MEKFEKLLLEDSCAFDSLTTKRNELLDDIQLQSTTKRDLLHKLTLDEKSTAKLLSERAKLQSLLEQETAHATALQEKSTDEGKQSQRLKVANKKLSDELRLINDKFLRTSAKFQKDYCPKALRERALDLESKIASVTKEINSVSEEVAKEQKALCDLKSQYKSESTKLVVAQTTAVELEEQVKDYTRQIASVDASLSGLDNSICALKLDEREAISRLENNRSSLQRQCDSVETQHASIQAALAAVVAECANVERQLNPLRRTNNYLLSHVM